MSSCPTYFDTDLKLTQGIIDSNNTVGSNGNILISQDSKVQWKYNISDKILLGTNAGNTSQGDNSIAIGKEAGQTQGTNCIAIGYAAGKTQGTNCIALGNNTDISINGQSASQKSNTIVLSANASANIIQTDTQNSGLHMTPIRSIESTTMSTSSVLNYNPTTSEITSGNVNSIEINTSEPTISELGSLSNNVGKFYTSIDASNNYYLRLRIKDANTTLGYKDLLIATYDNTPPTVTLVGSSSITKNIAIGETSYTESGVTVSDNNISFNGGNAITTSSEHIEGTNSISLNITTPSVLLSTFTEDDVNETPYTITYTATDNTGNTATKIRYITIVNNPIFNYSTHYKYSTILNTTNSTSSADDYFGNSVTISRDGLVIAVGITHFDDTNNNVGSIKIYKYSNNQWIFSETIIPDSTSIDSNFGININLNSTGSLLIVNNKTSPGTLKIYRVNGSYFTLEHTISGYNTNSFDNNSTPISLSEDGNVIAYGSYDVKRVDIYKYSNSVWSSYQTISEPYDTYFGYSLDLSEDGSILLVGTPIYGNTGKAYYYKLNNVTNLYENKLFSNIVSTNSLDKYAYSLSLNDDGKRFIISNYNKTVNNLTNCGEVYIYQVNSDYTSAELLITLSGYAANQNFGKKVKINGYGKTVAVSAFNSTTDNFLGFTKIYYEYQQKDTTTSPPKDSVWIEKDHKYIYSATDSTINFGFSMDFSIDVDRLVIGAPKLNIDSITDAGQVTVYQCDLTDAKIYNSWDLYLKDKTTAESGLNIDNLTNIKVYLAENKLSPNIETTNVNYKLTTTNNYITNIPIVDSFSATSEQIFIGKFDNTIQASSSHNYNIKSPNYKEYLSGSVSGDIMVRVPSSSAGALVIKIPIQETGDYVIYNSFFWPFGSESQPAGFKIYTEDIYLYQKNITTYFNSINITNVDSSFNTFVEYYSGGTINSDTIYGINLGNLVGTTDHIYLVLTNENNGTNEYGILRFKIAKRPNTIPAEFKHIVTAYTNQPACNPWNGTAIDERSPTVYNPLISYSKYYGRDLEIKLKITLNTNVVETYYFAGWRLDEVFNYYLNNNTTTSTRVFTKSQLTTDCWVTGNSIKSVHTSNEWQWSFTNEDNNSNTEKYGFGITEVEDVGIYIWGNTPTTLEKIEKLYNKNYPTGIQINNIEVYVKKAEIMAVPNENHYIRLVPGDSYTDYSASIYDFNTSSNDYSSQTPTSITSSFSPTLDTNSVSAGTYVQTYTVTYNSVDYITKRIIKVGTVIIANIPESGRYYSSILNHWSQYSTLDNQSYHVAAWNPYSTQWTAGGSWMQVNLGYDRTVTGVVTQGRGTGPEEWVTSYSVKYNNGNSWIDINSGQSFTANYDMHTKVTNNFTPVYTQAVRIYPQTWYGNYGPYMRGDVMIINY